MPAATPASSTSAVASTSSSPSVTCEGDVCTRQEGAAVKAAGGAPGFTVMSLAALLVWPGMVVLPLLLTLEGSPMHHTQIFDRDLWRDGVWKAGYPSPLGLSLGLATVAIGLVPTVAYHALRREGWLGAVTFVQEEKPEYAFFSGLRRHVAKPGGFLILGSYLCLTWMFWLMPASYYSFEGGINWMHVGLQLLVQDLVQYVRCLVYLRVCYVLIFCMVRRRCIWVSIKYRTSYIA